MPKVTVVCDLQFGSTGKGLIAGVIAKELRPDTLITTWMPNAGHTFIDKAGNKFVHTMLANGIVANSVRNVLIGPGSMINPDSLVQEIAAVGWPLCHGFNIWIHPNAGVVTEQHRRTEDGPMTKIGSTKKGCGAALIQRIERNPDKQNVASYLLRGTPLEKMVVTREQWDVLLQKSDKIMLEMAQGFSLSIYHGFYPYTTSRDVTPAQGMADAGLPLSWLDQVIGACRTYPIRVANRYDESGKMIGTSGPCYDDQVEMEWGDIDIEPELTTVTKLPRRIFTFSSQQMREAIFHCEPTSIFLNFMNYLDLSDQLAIVNEIRALGGFVQYVGFGPREDHVFDLDAMEGNLEHKLLGAAEYVKNNP